MARERRIEQAARALKSLTQSDAAVWKWADQLYGDAEPNQNAFLNDATANMTGDAVIAAFASLATRVAGTSAVDFVPKMQWGTKEDGAARDAYTKLVRHTAARSRARLGAAAQTSVDVSWAPSGV